MGRLTEVEVEEVPGEWDSCICVEESGESTSNVMIDR